MKDLFKINFDLIPHISYRSISCPLCHRKKTNIINSFQFNGKRLYTVSCIYDGMMWLNPQPTKEFYQNLYTKYYHHAEKNSPLLDQAIEDHITHTLKLKKIAKLRLKELSELLSNNNNNNNNIKLLEVGFGSGDFLIQAKKLGWEVEGVEIAKELVDKLKKKKIHAIHDTFPNIKLPSKKYDVIAMYNVLEHTKDPERHIQHAYELLKPSGILVFRIPNTPLSGPTIALISHIFHFNEKTISTFLQRNGFNIIKITDSGTYISKKYKGTVNSITIFAKSVK